LRGYGGGSFLEEGTQSTYWPTMTVDKLAAWYWSVRGGPGIEIIKEHAPEETRAVAK
jgi:hypothetical protein